MIDLLTNCPPEQIDSLTPHRQPVSELRCAGATDIGKTRDINQDHFLVANLQRVMNVLTSSVPEADREKFFGRQPGHLLVVADGMGGYEGGEKASCYAVQSASSYVLDMMHWFLRLTDDGENDFIEELQHCLARAQEKICLHANGKEHEMGTTLTLAYVIGMRLYLVHAGDTRCYLLRNGTLRQLTTDHTIAQRLYEDGVMTEDEAETSRWSHVLWNCVGGKGDPVRAEASRICLASGDRLLLCSDGLHGSVSQEHLCEILETSSTPDESVRRLIDKANHEGGRDNITAVVCHIPQEYVNDVDFRADMSWLADTAVLDSPS